MRRLNWISSVTAIAAAMVMSSIAPQTLRADDFNDRTIVHFSGAVEVPGAILQPGTYVFKVLESEADRVIVQISDERESHVFATAIATHNQYGTTATHRDDPLAPTPGKTVMTFYEAPAGQPQVLKTWFYPGQSFGFDFVYSKAH
jgi:hypothetical protein